MFHTDTLPSLDLRPLCFDTYSKYITSSYKHLGEKIYMLSIVLKNDIVYRP